MRSFTYKPPKTVAINRKSGVTVTRMPIVAAPTNLRVKTPETMRSNAPPVPGVPFSVGRSGSTPSQTRPGYVGIAERQSSRQQSRTRAQERNRVAKRQAINPTANPNVITEFPSTPESYFEASRQATELRRQGRGAAPLPQSYFDAQAEASRIRANWDRGEVGRIQDAWREPVLPIPPLQAGMPDPSSVPWSQMQIQVGQPPPSQTDAPTIAVAPATPDPQQGLPSPVVERGLPSFGDTSPASMPGFPWSGGGDGSPMLSAGVPAPWGMTQPGSPGAISSTDPYARLFT